jgi:hypothetical protein
VTETLRDMDVGEKGKVFGYAKGAAVYREKLLAIPRDKFKVDGLRGCLDDRHCLFSVHIILPDSDNWPSSGIVSDLDRCLSRYFNNCHYDIPTYRQ